MYGDTTQNNTALKQASETISEHLTDINAHTAEMLLAWLLGSREFTSEQDEIIFRAYENLKNFVYSHNGFSGYESAGN